MSVTVKMFLDGAKPEFTKAVPGEGRLLCPHCKEGVSSAFHSIPNSRMICSWCGWEGSRCSCLMREKPKEPKAIEPRRRELGVTKRPDSRQLASTGDKPKMGWLYFFEALGLVITIAGAAIAWWK
jgi:hypothetical protein